MFSFIETRLFTRIIYYVKRQDGVIWMLTIYAKNEAQTIGPNVLQRIKREIDA